MWSFIALSVNISAVSLKKLDRVFDRKEGHDSVCCRCEYPQIAFQLPASQPRKEVLARQVDGELKKVGKVW